MKSKSFKIMAITIAIISGIVITTVVTSIMRKNITANNLIVIKAKNQAIANKSEEIKKQQLKENELKKQQQQLNEKYKSLEKEWKIGYEQFFRREYNNAIQTERQVIKQDPTFYKAYAVEGIALAYSGDFEKGMKQIDLSLKLNPNYGYARFNKALANELYHHYDEAIIWYNKALEVEKFEGSYYGIASIYGRKGDIKNTAKTEEDFDNVRKSTEFNELIN
jgi:tetratricopeptide (TPR) repeat protein